MLTSILVIIWLVVAIKNACYLVFCKDVYTQADEILADSNLPTRIAAVFLVTLGWPILKIATAFDKKHKKSGS